jgi:hypothetical protein
LNVILGFSLREQNRLMAYESTLLRMTCGPKRDREIRVGRRLNNEKLHNPYSSPNTMWVTRSRMGTCEAYGERTGAYRAVVGKI